jgi:hypothetical protein
MELKMIMLSKISQAPKSKYHMFSIICGTRPKMMMILLIVMMGHICKRGPV